MNHCVNISIRFFYIILFRILWKSKIIKHRKSTSQNRSDEWLNQFLSVMNKANNNVFKTMSSSNTNSPLYKIRRPLEFLRWIGGFPIQPLDPSFSQFRFIPWLECIRFSIVILMFVLEHLYFILVVIIYEGNLNNYFSFDEHRL